MTVGSDEVVRSGEWRRVHEFAVSTRPRPAALSIAGEPGAGKSTLWRAGVAAAAGAGHRVLRSEPSAAEADLPFAGLSDLLSATLPDVGGDIPGPQRDALEVALLVRPAGAEPPTAHAVGLAVLAALRGLASVGPVLVAVDDVHWLDRLHDSADLCRGLWSRYTEDLGTARTALRRSIDRARDAGDDFAQATFLVYLAATEELAGDYPAARDTLAAADAAAAWHDWPPLPWTIEPRCDLLIAAGDLDGALALAEQSLPDTADQPAAARFLGGLVRGRVSAWRADTAGAVRWFERAAACADECDFADPGVRQGLDTGLAEAYLAEGRPADALRISAWLREIGDRLRRPVLTGNAWRIDAQAAAQAGDLDVAAESAQRAVAAHESAPLRPELARSLLVLGQVERRRRARRRSRGALGRAHDLAREMGHQPLLALIERELPRVAAARSGPELTATEQRVAELIAAGATNRDAAAALFVSVRTVETHVASIYRKLGVRSRAELARRFPQAPVR